MLINAYLDPAGALPTIVFEITLEINRETRCAIKARRLSKLPKMPQRTPNRVSWLAYV